MAHSPSTDSLADAGEGSGFLARVLDSFHHPVYVLDVRDYTLVYANAAARIHGEIRLGSTTCYALTHDRETPCDGWHPCPLQNLRKTGEATTTEHVHFGADGHAFPVEVHGEPISDETGEVRYMLEYSLDISGRRDMEVELQRAAMILEQSAEGIMITDPEQTIIEVNPSFTAITGYPAEEVIGRTPRILSSGEQNKDFYTTLWDCLNREGYWKGEIWNRYRDGSIVPQWETIFAIRDPEGRLVNYVAIFHEISDQKQKEDELRSRAMKDPLTGLWNRHGLYGFIDRARTANQRDGTPFALLMFDIDHFKAINDHHGHQMGDQVLLEVTQRVTRELRETDRLGRWGGEEFMLLLHDVSLADATTIGERILAAVNGTPCQQVGTVTVSIGIAAGSAHEGIAQLEERVDRALYQAKEGGRARLCLDGEDPRHPGED